MKYTGRGILLTAALSYVSIAGAQDQGESQGVFKTKSWRDDFSVSVGTKVWFNQWTTWDTRTVFASQIDVSGQTLGAVPAGGFPAGTFLVSTDNSGNITNVANISGQTFGGVAFPANTFVAFDPSTAVVSSDSDGYEFVPIPVISVKYKDVFVSASYFVDTEYRFSSLGNLDVDRREWDVTAGYYILPPYLALTAGYKDIQQEFGSLDVDEFEVTGPTVGFVGAVPMKWGFSLYSNFAYGFLQMESEAFKFIPAPSTDDDRDSQYWLAEGGIAYTHDLSNLPAHLLLNSATFYAGYRHQQVETDIFDSSDADDGVDTTRGMVIGLNLAF